MDCPVCTTTALLMSERQGIEIDYCPQCRGVWLDRGELDKLVERSQPAQAVGHHVAPPPPPGGTRDVRDGRSGQGQREHQGAYGGHPQGYGHKKKKGGFLSDLFDF